MANSKKTANDVRLTETQKRHDFFEKKMSNLVASTCDSVKKAFETISDEKLENLTSQIKKLNDEKRERIYELSVTNSTCLEKYEEMIEFAFFAYGSYLGKDDREVSRLWQSAKGRKLHTPKVPINTTNKLSNFVHDMYISLAGKSTAKVKTITFEKALETVTIPLFDGIKARYRKALGVVGATNRANDVVSWYVKRSKDNDQFAASYNKQLRFMSVVEEKKEKKGNK